MPCNGAMLHAENHIDGKFPAALFQHIIVDIADQSDKDD